MRVVNQSRGIALAERAEVAESLLARGVGLIGRRDWLRSDGLVIRPCNSVHCCLMSMPIDVAYVDAQDRICRVAPNLKPWRFGPMVFSARYVVELPAGRLARTSSEPGDQLVLEPIEE